jgi:NAD-dependent dihydropyrimidine dehydrogenase PreA subunit
VSTTEIDPIYRELAAKMRRPNSEVLPKILQKLANLEQARVVRELPAPPEEIAKKLGLSKETVEKHIQELFEKGLIQPGKRGWNMAATWGWLHDTMGSADDKYDDDELWDLSVDMTAENLEDLQKLYEKDKDKAAAQPYLQQLMRVIPRWKSIKDIPGVLPCEDVREIFKKPGKIAVTRCPCKRVDRKRECKDEIPLELCVHATTTAAYHLKRKTGRELTPDEAMKLLDQLDELPLVNLVMNTNDVPNAVCNCHNCCCGMFLIRDYTKKHFNRVPFAKSRFIAEVDAEKCSACRTCVDTRCPVGAAKMKHYPEFGEERAYTDPEECLGCGLCVLTCPTGAHKMKLVRPPEYIPALSMPFDLGIDVTQLT